MLFCIKKRMSWGPRIFWVGQMGSQHPVSQFFQFCDFFSDSLEETFYILAQIEDIFGSKFIHGLKTDLAPNFIRELKTNLGKFESEKKMDLAKNSVF